MYKWSKKSAEKLATCDTDLVQLFSEVLNYRDCRVLDGARSEYRQNLYFSEGKSKLQYPNSGHNKYPSLAVDVVPHPVDWDDIRRFKEFRDVVYGVHRILES
jgi:peptidoglycan L-alanyl-D-glutamate endopeptidase CwlK